MGLVTNMGCCNSRTPLEGTKEQVLQTVIKEKNLHKPTIRLILQTFNQYENQQFLVPMQLSNIARNLDITLDPELFWESLRDKRISRWKLLTALTMLSCDSDLEGKKAVFAPFVGGEKRKLMRLLEWRAELLGKRLVDAAVRSKLMSLKDGNALKLRNFPVAMKECVQSLHYISNIKASNDDFLHRNLYQVKF